MTALTKTITIFLGGLIIGFIIFAFIQSAYGVTMSAHVEENNCNLCVKVCETVSEKEWREAQDKIWQGWDDFVKEQCKTRDCSE